MDTWDIFKFTFWKTLRRVMIEIGGKIFLYSQICKECCNLNFFPVVFCILPLFLFAHFQFRKWARYVFWEIKRMRDKKHSYARVMCIMASPHPFFLRKKHHASSGHCIRKIYAFVHLQRERERERERSLLISTAAL